MHICKGSSTERFCMCVFSVALLQRTLLSPWLCIYYECMLWTVFEISLLKHQEFLHRARDALFNLHITILHYVHDSLGLGESKRVVSGPLFLFNSSKISTHHWQKVNLITLINCEVMSSVPQLLHWVDWPQEANKVITQADLWFQINTGSLWLGTLVHYGLCLMPCGLKNASDIRTHTSCTCSKMCLMYCPWSSEGFYYINRKTPGLLSDIKI